MRRLKDAKKKADQLVTMRLKEQHGGEFSGFFCLIYLRLEAEEAGNPEMPMSTDQKSQEMPVLSVQRARKWTDYPKRKVLDSKCLNPAK